MLGWELPPHNSGGLGVACYQLCKALSKKAVDIEFVLPYTADHDVDFMKIHNAAPLSPTEVLHNNGVYDSGKYRNNGDRATLHEHGAHYEERVAQLAETATFDVIHAHDWLTCRAAMRAKEISERPLVVHMHSIEADRAGGLGKGNPLVREIESQALLLADRVIAVSELTKQAIMREYGIPEDKIDVIHNSIDHSWYEPLSGNTVYTYLATMKSHGYRVVVNAGRVTIQKGLSNLLYAAQEVVVRAPKTLFLIVGNGEQERELLELAAQLGISQNVIFTGFQRGKRLRDTFAIGDLFVMPSVSEPFGLAPLEAIGYGTPALISKQSGVAEVLKNVLKVDFWDVREMANQITAVVQNDSLRDELHTQAEQEYRRLSWENAADRLLEAYKWHVGKLQGVSS